MKTKRTHNFDQNCHIGFRVINKSTRAVKRNSYTVTVKHENKVIVKLPSSIVLADYPNDSESYDKSDSFELKFSRAQKRIKNVTLEIRSGGLVRSIGLEWSKRGMIDQWHRIEVGEGMVQARLFC